MAEFVEIFEVGPRDGLQNEARLIPAAEKIALVDVLSGAGFRRIECASFVSPKWVPQMATSAEVLAGITRVEGLRYAALTPNLKGLEGAIAAKADEGAIFGSAAEGFSKANINTTIAESLERFGPVAEAARAVGLPVRGYVSCVVECPYDGAVAPAAVARVAGALLAMGCYEISLGDTIGRARPEAVAAMLEAVLSVVPADKLAGHFHDTGGRALENIEVALGDGIKRPSLSEIKNMPVARKSLVASRLIKAGEKFTSENMTAKRPGTGVSPMRWDEIVGKTALRAYVEDELIDE